ncbi:MAG: hypothetical protein L6Q98_08235 [Anaerolineae bacterium]|nr:hypothetical protein [Anaerolineae bacterium]NUQ02578.1 hypothetical protein [Anaerolineae bacterium]
MSTASTSTGTIPAVPALRNRQQLAWGIVLLCFSVFCVMAALALVGLHYFVFQSTIPMRAQLQVSRATASLISADLIEQAVRNERNLGSGDVVATPQSQAQITFRDPNQDSLVVARVIVKDGAAVVVRYFVRPRFDWSSESYSVYLDDLTGELDVEITEGLSRVVTVIIETRNGARVFLEAPGRYSIAVGDAHLQVVNYEGSARLVTADQRPFPIPAAQQGMSSLEDPSQFYYAPALVNVLGAATFSSDNVLDYNTASDQASPSIWRCSSLQDSGPVGRFELITEDGFPALQLFRGENAESHGETRCIQLFYGNEGVDVSSFRHISVRVTFKIRSHSLNLCGVDGSECPLMMRMEFNTAGNSEIQHWIHGFFTHEDPIVSDYPPLCDTCIERHEMINPDRWYTYESDNLLPTLELLGKRPVSLLNMRFYASGHQYDVLVRKVELLVDQTIAPIPTTEEQGG